MPTVNLEQAQGQLRELIAGLQPGQEVILTDNGLPLAKLVGMERTNWPCKAGTARDEIVWIAPDFDAPLEDFKEYAE